MPDPFSRVATGATTPEALEDDYAAMRAFFGGLGASSNLAEPDEQPPAHYHFDNHWADPLEELFGDEPFLRGTR
ncbi:MAG: hypothetical protein AAGF99_00330 [Bacteroidota bacterium]